MIIKQFKRADEPRIIARLERLLEDFKPRQLMDYLTNYPGDINGSVQGINDLYAFAYQKWEVLE